MSDDMQMLRDLGEVKAELSAVMLYGNHRS